MALTDMVLSGGDYFDVMEIAVTHTGTDLDVTGDSQVEQTLTLVVQQASVF